VGGGAISVPGLEAIGWAFGLGASLLLAGGLRREARRREGLNRAMHELRRPLQALVLSPGPTRGGSAQAARLALAALGDLDLQVNGGGRPFAPRPIVCRALVHHAVERWRGIAASSERSLVLNWRAGSAVVMADPGRLAQALDNLIENAIRHGGLRVRVEAWAFAGGVRISVADSGGGVRPRSGGGDPRHGHGLRIVSAVAAEHGGRFLLRSSPAGTLATLELPFGPGRPPSPGRGAGLIEGGGSEHDARRSASPAR
jgi:signal transduction histidine kinase